MPRISGQTDDDGVLLRIGQAIRSVRLEQSLSQEELADAAGIDRSHMGRIERGQRNVTVLNLNRIASALGLDLAQLFSAASS